MEKLTEMHFQFSLSRHIIFQRNNRNYKARKANAKKGLKQFKEQLQNAKNAEKSIDKNE